MEHYLQPEFVKNCLVDLCTIHLTIIGVCLTVFTLLYSFIFSKRAEISVYSDELKSKLVDPLIAQKYGQVKKYIKSLSKIISKCKYTLILSMLTWVLCWIDKMFIFPLFWKYGIFIIALILSLIELIICIIWGRLIIIQYNKDIDV